MTTITLTRENFGKKMATLYKQVLSQSEIKISIEKQKDITRDLHRLSNDPNNTSYGPFPTMSEAVDFLNSGVGR